MNMKHCLCLHSWMKMFKSYCSELNRRLFQCLHRPLSVLHHLPLPLILQLPPCLSLIFQFLCQLHWKEKLAFLSLHLQQMRRNRSSSLTNYSCWNRIRNRSSLTQQRNRPRCLLWMELLVNKHFRFMFPSF